jgi:hypothetical protein
MHRRLCGTSMLMVAVFVLWSRTAAGEPVQLTITGGQLQMGTFSGSLALIGERDFTLTAGVGVIDGFFGPWVQCNTVFGCTPGTALNFDAVFVGSSLRGTTVTIEGETFTNVTSAAATSGAAAFFTGSAVLPPFDSDTATVAGFFRLEGLFAYPVVGGEVRPLELLYGQGTATISLERHLVGPTGSWRYTGATYAFDPIPEPATLLLAGTGLVWLVRRRTRRAR